MKFWFGSIFGFEMSKLNLLTLKLRFVGRCWLESGSAVEYVNPPKKNRSSTAKGLDLTPLRATGVSPL